MLKRRAISNFLSKIFNFCNVYSSCFKRQGEWKCSRTYYQVFEALLNIENLCYFTENPPGTRTRSSPSEVFLGKGVLKKYSKFRGEHPCQSVISIKLICRFIEITLHHGCSSVNLLYFFRAPFLRKPRNGGFWRTLILFSHLRDVRKMKNNFQFYHFYVTVKYSFWSSMFPLSLLLKYQSLLILKMSVRQKRIHNPVKHLRWSFFSESSQLLTYSEKCSILDN